MQIYKIFFKTPPPPRDNFFIFLFEKFPSNVCHSNIKHFETKVLK